MVADQLRKVSQPETFFVALDIETTGSYPIKWEICEIAGVKWKDGQIIDEFSQLVRPKGPMHPVAYQIHGISMAALDHQPYIEEVLPQFLTFIEDATLIAHHAPFDIGFLTYDIEEKCQLSIPTNKIICTSLLSQKLFPQSPNYKLKTLMEYLKLEQPKPYHRSLSDAKACLLLALECFKKIQPLTIDVMESLMGVSLEWPYFSLKQLKTEPNMKVLVEAILGKKQISIVYHRGSRPGVARKLLPIGLVRNPKGDFLVADDHLSDKPKRFYLNFVTDIRLVR